MSCLSVGIFCPSISPTRIWCSQTIHRFVVLVCVFCTVNCHGEEPSTIEGIGWLLWDHPSWYIIPPMKQHAKKISPHIPGIPRMISENRLNVGRLVSGSRNVVETSSMFSRPKIRWFCFFMRHFAWWRQLMAWPSVNLLENNIVGSTLYVLWGILIFRERRRRLPKKDKSCLWVKGQVV